MTARGSSDQDAVARLEKVKAPKPPAPVQLHAIRVPVPRAITAEIACPQCGIVVALEAKLSGRLVRDSDGTTTLALRTRAPKLAHTCDQLALGLEGAAPIKPTAATGEHSR